jgi:hypothetical protein
MRTISELNMLLRAQAELPDGLNLATEEFHEGWKLCCARSTLSGWKRRYRRGDGILSRFPMNRCACGVGDTSQEAIASALKLALRRISTQFNAAKVEHIELVEYPWFFLARVRVYPCHIQQGAALAVPEESFSAHSAAPRLRRLPLQAKALYPYFGSNIPQLKQMLVSSRAAGAGPQ